MKLPVNYDIATTHILTRKKQTLVAALGVTLGVSIYLFMNSLNSGFLKFSRDEIFKNSAHIRVFKDDVLSKPLFAENDSSKPLIVNPQVLSESKTLVNPSALLNKIKQQPYITYAQAQVNFDCFYNRGKTQVKGNGNGVNILEYQAMYNLQKYVEGDINDLKNNLNGIIIGSGIAKDLSLGIGDNISVTSSYNVLKVMKIVGIYTSGNKINDNSKSFVNINAAQQFLKEGPSFVSAIYANTPDADNTAQYVRALQKLTPYTVEDWKTTNADILSADKTRSMLMGAISLSILFVAAFGIYNILNMTVSQKIDDIAILKAIGFSGNDVVVIFVCEAILMGAIGTIIGLGFGAVLIKIMAGVYVGGPVGYFPVYFNAALFLQSLGLGLLMTLLAGYIPARKASQVDPVSIFRK